MPNITLVTGGARSGKSTFAESIARKSKNSVLYIATSIPFDEEMKQRVKKHREQRPSEWDTLEEYRDFDIHLSKPQYKKSVLLVDCITIMVTNIMLNSQINWDEATNDDILHIEKIINDEIDKLIQTSAQSGSSLIIVTNELGMGIVPENKLGRIFRDIAGRVNQNIANIAQEVYLCVCGIPIKIKEQELLNDSH